MPPIIPMLCTEAMKHSTIPFLSGGGVKIPILNLKNHIPLLMILFTFFLASRAKGQTCDCSDFPTYKCINSGLLSDLIANGDLLDYAHAAVEPQYIVVESDINFYDASDNTPYHFAPGSEIVMLQNAGLVISKEVVLDEVNIFGCGFWEKMRVNGSGTLRIRNSQIANACESIVLNQGAKAEIVSNYFVNNGACITASNSVTLLGEGVAHNVFDGDGFTIGCSGNTFRYAIKLDDVPYIEIGNSSGNGSPNQFLEYNGIWASNSNIGVYNSRILNFPNGGSGIRLDGGLGVNTAYIQGLGHTENSPTFIENMAVGIRAIGYHLTVNDAFFHTGSSAFVRVRQSNKPTILSLTYNRFENYPPSGVDVSLCKFVWAKIVNNEFYDGNVESIDSKGIEWVSNEIVGTNSTAMMQDNTFYDEDKGEPDIVTFDHTGISVRLSSGVTVKENTFYQNFASDYPHIFSGVKLYEAPGNKIQNNQFIGNHGPLTVSGASPDSYKALDVEESGANLISCNSSSNLNHGFRFQGPGCDQTNFHHNGMEDNLTGLYLYPGSIMGAQFERENGWSGSLPGNGIAEAHFDGNPDDQSMAMSLFSINSSNPSSDFWANPRIPSDDWFEDSQGQPSIYADCYEVWTFPLPPSVSDDRAIGDEFEGYKGYPASEWEAALRAYGTLYHNSDYRAGNGTAASFYALHDTANIGKLYRASETWKTLGRMDSGFEADWSANATAISLKLDTITSLVAEMETADEADQDSLASILALHQEDVATLQIDNAELADQYIDTLADRANQLASNLEGINSVDVWEQNIKTVLTIFVERLQDPEATEWTTEQYDTLLSIADQCRHEGGIGVVMARAAIEQYDYDDEAMCPGASQSRRVSTTAALQGSISPNPASDYFTIRLDRPVTGQVALSNMHGQSLRSVTLKGNASVEVDTQHLPSGIYQVNVLAADGAQLLKRISIVR